VPLFNGGKGPILYSCSCAQFHQYFFCPHVLAHAINEKELVVPIDRQIAVIGRSGKAGRPKKATAGAALVRDAEQCAVNNRAKRGTASQQVGSRQSTASANGSRSHRLPSEELQPSQLSRRGMQSQPPPQSQGPQQSQVSWRGNISQGAHISSSTMVDPMCAQCGKGNQKRGNMILHCDRCEQSWHQQCHVPLVLSIPAGVWMCTDCE
jgi:ribosomal protein L37AE/L43A